MVTGHKSYALPGRAVTNEIAMDDSAGAQRVSINGGKDINVVVANDRMLNVGANATRTVIGQRTSTVSGNESVSVEGSDSMLFLRSKPILKKIKCVYRLCYQVPSQMHQDEFYLVKQSQHFGTQCVMRNL